MGSTQLPAPRQGPRCRKFAILDQAGLHGVQVISGPGDTGQVGGEGPHPGMHTPGRLGCGPADGEARATPAPMSVPTCCLLVGLALWASSPCGPGLWACCPPFRSSGVEAGFSFQIPHAWPQRQAEPCRGCPTPTSWRPSRNRMAWYPGGGGPRRTSENWTQPCSARRRLPGQRGSCFPAEGKEDSRKTKEKAL